MIDEYIKQAPLNNVQERAAAITYLLSGTPLSNWQNVLAQLPEGYIWKEESFQKALNNFLLSYCSSKAQQEQKMIYETSLGTSK